MKKVIVSIIAVALILSAFSFVFANDNLRVEKKADIENIVGTTPEKIVKDVEELEDEILEEVKDAANANVILPPNPLLTSPAESDVALRQTYTDEGDVFVSNDNVDLNNRQINGNLFVMGDNINITSVNVSGDAFILGKNINIRYFGVDNSIYFLGQKITADSISAKDVYSLGEDLSITTKAVITRNLNSLGSSLNLDGVRIGRDLNFYGNTSGLAGETNVAGTFNYRSPNEAVISEDSKVNDINKTIIEETEIEVEEEKTPAEIFKNAVVTFLLTWIAGIFMLLIVSKVEGADKYKNAGLRILGEFILGLVVGIVALAFGLILIIFTAGIAAGLVLIVWLLLFISALFAGAATSHSFARAFSKSYDGKKVFWLAFAIYTVYSVIKLIPGVGICCLLVAFFIGNGHNAIELCKLISRKFERKEPIAKEDSKVAVEPPTETPAIEPEKAEEPEEKEE